MKRNTTTAVISPVVLGMMLCLTGCEPCTETNTSVIQAPQYEFMLVFALDTSPSFTEKMFEKDAPAYRFFTSSLEQYFQGRGVPQDRVLIANLADEDCPLLWQGTPHDLRAKFDKPEALKQFLKEHAKPTKHVYGALANTIDYVTDLPPIRNGNAKTCVVVLSDMMDKSGKREEDHAKMAAALKRLSGVRSELGFWWIDQRAIKDCQKCFRDAGLPEPQFQMMEENPTPLDFSGTN